MSKNSGVADNSSRRRNTNANRRSVESPYGPPTQWKTDGVDHINIYNFGATDLGQLLDFKSRLELDHNIFGKFNSLWAFWNYIKSAEKDDRIRRLFGKKLSDFVKQLNQVSVVNFRAIIMDSNYQRLMMYPQVVEEIKNSTLPFDVYIIQGTADMRIRPPYFSWFLWGFEETRAAMKEGREPDFTPLMDNSDKDMYKSIRPAAVDKPAKSNPRSNALWDRITADRAEKYNA